MNHSIFVLTTLLEQHGVRRAVVCPGSRNAPIVHQLYESKLIKCCPVTDERSAGFYALGLTLATHKPVVVCVTSGTALLNLAPAVAEAFYQHLPVIVISADRPISWIDQLDGQTMPQSDALGRFVRRAVTLPETGENSSQYSPTEHWYCNRLINETLLAAVTEGGGPVHINVPLTPPLYDFQNTIEQTAERTITLLSPFTNGSETFPPVSVSETEPTKTTSSGNNVANVKAAYWAQPMLNELAAARRPLIVIGQTRPNEISQELISRLDTRHYVVLQEPLSGCWGGHVTDEILQLINKDNDSNITNEYACQPDFVLYLGHTLVSNDLKLYIRHATQARCWRVDEEPSLPDTFQNLCGVVQARPVDVLANIVSEGPKDWYMLWNERKKRALEHRRKFNPPYSEMLAVKLLENSLTHKDSTGVIHYANSMAVRFACIYAEKPVYCNRGVNGIDGSLSTAAGFSLGTTENVYCVTGDLSFFYDQNALWNTSLKGNFRILLLNNGEGGIFRKFKGLRTCPEIHPYVMGTHRTHAEGICQANNVDYQIAHNNDELKDGISWLTEKQAERPRVLEVVTNDVDDWNIYRDYFATLH
ncbi:MAG: 2-succinyl-5-enolpyruvyl-6-hydroxy-3-cyclohexene-1-carboxylic-acid synthase [Prevotella sp.]|jgi:2-succinyl-5-enolpyruvyl-6-hydroxy-3-cyclohexene-1-carboxylate synthase